MLPGDGSKIVACLDAIWSGESNLTCLTIFIVDLFCSGDGKSEKVQIGKDQEKAQSAKDSHSKNPRWEKNKLTIRYLYHENIP